MSKSEDKPLSDAELQKAWEPVLGYKYKKTWFLMQALTTKEYSLKHANTPHKEALEVLGKSIIDTVIAEHAIKKLNHGERGEIENYRLLTYDTKDEFGRLLLINIRSQKLSQKKKATELFRMTPEEEKRVKKEELGFIGEFTESLVGSVYLDSDFEKAKEVAKRLLLLELDIFLKTVKRVAAKELDTRDIKDLEEEEVSRKEQIKKLWADFITWVKNLFKKKVKVEKEN